jgi:hypothetical protein
MTFTNHLVWRTDEPPDYSVLVATEHDMFFASRATGVWVTQYEHVVPGVVCWADPMQPWAFIKHLNPSAWTPKD